MTTQQTREIQHLEGNMSMIIALQKEFIGDPNVSAIDYTKNTQLAKCIIMNDHHSNLTSKHNFFFNILILYMITRTNGK
jgi:hypothetical protein